MYMYIQLEKCWFFIWTNLNPLHQRMLCLEFRLKICYCFPHDTLSKNLTPHLPKDDFAKFTWNYFSSSVEVNKSPISLSSHLSIRDSTLTLCQKDSSGADPGIYVSGGALDRRGVWGPPRSRSPAGPGQGRWGALGGEGPRELMRIRNFRKTQKWLYFRRFLLGARPQRLH